MSTFQTVSTSITRLRAAARSGRLPLWSVPLALLALIILSYGLRAISLGFFWDDWPYLWYFHLFGASGIVDAFTNDRPFLSFIYTLTLTILGNSTRAWQIFALLAHWLCCVGLWGVLALTWPRNAHKAAWAAMLFAVYPGFTQNWIAIIYGQAYLLFAFTFFSMVITLWLARGRPNAPLTWLASTLLALLLSAFTMFSTEYFFGLELLRPVLLWLLLAEQMPFQPASAPRLTVRSLVARLNWPAVGQAMRWWSPYLALMLIFVFWRGVLQPFPGKSLVVVSGVESSPLSTLTDLAVTILEDSLEAGLVAWSQILNLGHFLENPAIGLRLLLMMLVLAALALAYLLALRPRPSTETPWALQAGLVGGLAFLLAGWPFWITGLPMHMGFPQDRYSLPLSVGVSLLIAALIDGLIKDWPRKAVVLAVLLAMAGGFHFNLALSYRNDWNNMRDFFWQLTWRAPGVQPNTLFLFDRLPFLYYEDDSLTAPLNWVYAPDFKGRQMPYLLYDLYVRRNSLHNPTPGQPVKRDFRATYFEGSTSQVLVVDLQSTGCVHVLDPVYHAGLYTLPNRLQRALPLSSPASWVLPAAAPAQPPQELFGAESPHRWCYYYQKAELARQVEDWAAIRELALNSLGAGLKPETSVELLPFIEGYARLGLYEDAYQLTRQAHDESVSLRPPLCAIWQRTLDQLRRQSLPPGDLLLTRVEQMNTLVGCSIK